MWCALLVAAVLAADAADPPDAPDPVPAGPAPREIGLDLSANAQMALAAFAGDAPPPVGGHDPRRSGFSLQVLELSFGQPVDPYFRLDGHLAVSEHGLEIEEVYATTLALPGRLQLRAGQFLTRFGRANALHGHQRDFVDTPLVVGRFLGAEGNRGVGLEGSVLLPLPWFVELAVATTTAHGAETAPSFLGDRELDVRGPQDLQWTATLEQFWALSPAVGLFGGLSWATGPNPTGPGNRTELYGADLHLKLKPSGRFSEIVLQGEVVGRRAQVPGDLRVDGGAHAQITWRFRPRWTLAGRWERGSATVDAHGHVVAHPASPEWTAPRDRVAAALTLQPTEFSRVRLQVARDAPGWRDPSHAAFLQLSFGAGSHGAHTY